MDIVVYGAGSLGSLVGGALATVHDVTLVGRADHVATVAGDGLRVERAFDGDGGPFEPALDRTTAPEATTDGRELRADLALVTVKAFDTDAAAADLATGAFDAVCSLQNGMGNEARLTAVCDAPVLAGTTTYGARRTGPGRVACTGVGEVVLGPADGGESAVADRVGEAFRAAGFATTVARDMPRRLWEKLAVNAGINAVTALSRVENGALLDGPANDLARAAARETARIARAEDVSLSDRTAVAAVESVADATAANVSSMAQDVRAGRRTEVFAINGYVVDRGDEHRREGSTTPADEYELDVPTNRTLTRLLRAWERGEGLR
jgi:2-dehydropantoate 2-reductase